MSSQPGAFGAPKPRNTVATVLCAAFLIVSATGDRTWPKVTGTSLSQRFVGIVSPVPPAKAGAGSGTSILWRWRVVYEYEVAGQRYRGEAWTAQPPLSRPRIYYHPTHPHVSALDPGIDLFALFSLFVLAFVLYLASQFCHGAAGS